MLWHLCIGIMILAFEHMFNILWVNSKNSTLDTKTRRSSMLHKYVQLSFTQLLCILEAPESLSTYTVIESRLSKLSSWKSCNRNRLERTIGSNPNKGTPLRWGMPSRYSSKIALSGYLAIKRPNTPAPASPTVPVVDKFSLILDSDIGQKEKDVFERRERGVEREWKNKW